MIQRPLSTMEMEECDSRRTNKTMLLKPNKMAEQCLSLLFFTNLQNLLNPWLDLQFSLLHRETLMLHFTWWQRVITLSPPELVFEDWYCNQQQMFARESCWHIGLWIIPCPSCAVSSTHGHTANRSYITTADVREVSGMRFNRAKNVPLFWVCRGPTFVLTFSVHPTLKCLLPSWLKS